MAMQKDAGMFKPHSHNSSCPTCGKGTIKATIIQNYKTRIRGYPFTVPQACIGTCDQCGERVFTAKETRRWEVLFDQALEARHALLSPEEVTHLRQRLGLSKKGFAHLLGVSLRSIHHWEDPERQTAPSRGADLMMRLVQKGLDAGSVDVIDFLLDEAKKWGIELQVQREVAA